MALPPPPAKLSDGRVSLGRRPMTDAERADLRERYRRHRRRKLLFGIAIALLPFTCSGIFLAAPLDNPSITIPLLLGTIFGVGWLVVVANDALRPIPGVELLAATEVERFGDPNGDGVTEVVPPCGAVLTHDGQPLRRLLWAQVLLPPVPAVATAIRGGERSLAPAEVEEVRQVARATRGHLRKEAPGFLFCLAIGPIFLTADPKVHPVPFLIGLFGAGIGVRAIFSILGSLRVAKRLDADAEAGTVRDVNRTEILPHSGLTWTERGEAAPWRSSHLPQG